MRTADAELALTTAFLRRTLSIVGVRAQAKLLGRLEVIGPGAEAAPGRRNFSPNLEMIWANQRRADLISKALLSSARKEKGVPYNSRTLQN